MEKSKDKTGGISYRINIRQKSEERSGRRNNQKRKEWNKLQEQVEGES